MRFFIHFFQCKFARFFTNFLAISPKIFLNFVLRFCWIIFCLFSLPAQAQLERITTFDDRKLCEDGNGVWHDFGDECGDFCESKFEYSPTCTKRVFYSCDCGARKCFNGKECVKIQDYWQEYAAKQLSQQPEIEAAKKKRAKQYAQMQRSRAGVAPAKPANNSSDNLNQNSANGDELKLPQEAEQSDKLSATNSQIPQNFDAKNSSKLGQAEDSSSKNVENVEIVDLLKNQLDLQQKRSSSKSVGGNSSISSLFSGSDENPFPKDQNSQGFSDKLIQNVQNKMSDDRMGDNNNDNMFDQNQQLQIDQNRNLVDFTSQDQQDSIPTFKID